VLQLTILTRSAWTWFELSSLKLMSLMMKVQTSSQKRYVSRCPYRDGASVRVRPAASVQQAHLERQTGLDLLCEPVRDCFVEVYEDLHGQLGLDSALGDQVVERVCEGTAQTVLRQPVRSQPVPQERMNYLLRR
jgi:hypothetical protein